MTTCNVVPAHSSSPSYSSAWTSVLFRSNSGVRDSATSKRVEQGAAESVAPMNYTEQLESGRVSASDDDARLLS